ncbi:hypothetical protein AUC68_06050 [Methyloceanibacter methanicus]|uniref:Copper chaperone PCu(A)C n=1 Tax=Methyloceanibacter methanicus TaxID=1774968 RepID=A0A1E3VZ36_9HYPH|nr:copper chaperone PCu(A)C [Methyloceanibacter methanicus]ODR98769.1 hypothetical protein AUC68_06050 [Methyloceanibacter methanicus]
MARPSRHRERKPAWRLAFLVQLCVLSIFPLYAFSHSGAAPISVENAWSRATPGGVKVGVGFATIRNRSEQDDRLVSATTDVAGKTEIHEMTMEGGVMKMRRIPDGLMVPADGEVLLKPGGYHLMLMDLKQPLTEGDQFSGVLTFENAGAVNVIFSVMGLGAASTDGAHNHH